jgi:hypothetical protein
MKTTALVRNAITLGLPFMTLASAGARAEPVRIAVAGVAGAAADEETLKRLSQALRAELAAQVDPSVFLVVSREEMTRVYEEQHRPCPPEDGGCLVAASARWSGGLFVRGRLTTTATGLVFAASLDSVRGLHVADAGFEVESAAAAELAVPHVVEQLLTRERAFRARMSAQDAPEASSPAKVKEAAARVVCHASQQGLVSRGDVAIDEGGVSFTSPLTNKWRKSWTQLDTLTPTVWFNHPALYLTTHGEFDPLYIWFNTEQERDRCIHEIEGGVGPHASP